MKRFQQTMSERRTAWPVPPADGFSLIELMVALAIATVLTVAAIPVIGSTMARMKVNSGVSTISAAMSKTRYRSIRDSNVYTLAITVPQNTYVVTNVNTNVVDRTVPLPSALALNGGAAAVLTYTFCPNGTSYGTGGACPNANLPPVISVAYKTLQTNLSLSTVGNVTTTVIR